MYEFRLYIGAIKSWLYKLIFYYGYIQLIPFRVWLLRRKNEIKVLFVISEISMWKTESLYLEMLKNQRFKVYLLAVPNMHDKLAYRKMEESFSAKGYAYVPFESISTIKQSIHPDIIFYQQAYDGFIDERYFYSKNLYALFCHVNYCFRNTLTKSTVDLPLLNMAWRVCSENKECSEELSLLMGNGGKNLVNTGLPFMDELINYKKCVKTKPWKGSRCKKTIIYAPHHSILAEDKLSWGAIVEYGDFILGMAKKYHDSTQWIFKPHPFLKNKLKQIWGEEKTDMYYRTWSELDNSQMVDGEYLDAFFHSDAMMHDCGSFSIEYLYTGNPVLYLYSSRTQKKVGITKMTKDALELHYKATKTTDIEEFIINVIKGNDILSTRRKEFVRSNLTPSGESASCNIIDSILSL